MSFAPRRMMPGAPGRRRQEARDVHEREHGDVERVARAHEPRRLLGRVDVERARHREGLVRHDADRLALHVPEPDQHVLREQRLDLEERALVEHVLDHRAHVVRLRVRVRDERVELLVLLRDRELDVVGQERRRVRQVVLRQVRHEVAHVVDRVVLVAAR